MKLTAEETAEIMRENGEHGWGYTKEETLAYIEKHRTGDAHEKAAVEYRFEDVNYHEINRCLEKGDYAGAIAFVNDNWDLTLTY